MSTFSKLLHSITRAIRRVQRRLSRRRTTIDAKITVALPPVLKIEIGMKSEPPPAANDNTPRRVA
jgi:hypothetical protein